MFSVRFGNHEFAWAEFPDAYAWQGWQEPLCFIHHFKYRNHE